MNATALRTLAWFLRRPAYYGELLAHLRRRLAGAPAQETDTRVDALAWCRERAMDNRQALDRLTGRSDLPSFESIFPREIAAGQRAVAACPVKMGGAGNLDVIYHLCEYLRAWRVIETGVANGWSTLAILLSIRDREGARLVSTDMPYLTMSGEAHVGQVVPAELRLHWCLIRHADRKAIPMAIANLETVDLCHYDSAKSYAARMWAYPLLWTALRSGGMLISDDIGDNVAFRDFAAQVGQEAVVVEWAEKFIGVLRKA